MLISYFVLFKQAYVEFEKVDFSFYLHIHYLNEVKEFLNFQKAFPQVGISLIVKKKILASDHYQRKQERQFL